MYGLQDLAEQVGYALDNPDKDHLVLMSMSLLISDSSAS